jgi:hypothetical protein
MLRHLSSINNIFAAAAVAVTVLSCSQENDETTYQEGNSYASLNITISSPEVKSMTQGEWSGRANESTVESIDLITSNHGNKSWSIPSSEVTESGSTYVIEPFKVKPGNDMMAMAINMPSDLTFYPSTSQPILYGTEGNEIQDIYDATNPFIMTTSRQLVDILQGITKEEASQGPDNHYSFEADRIVSQALVIDALDDSYNEYDGRYYPTVDMLDDPTDAEYSGYVDVTSLTYSVENGAVTEYLLPENAGTLSNGKYTDYKSYLHESLTDFAACKDTAYVKPYLIRLGNLFPYDSTLIDGGNSQLGGYQAISVFSSLSDAQADDAKGIYFFENSVDSTYMTESNKDYGYYRLPYVKVYATFIPAVLWQLSDGQLVKAVNVGPNTFYRGAEDGLFYSTREAAAASTTNPGQGSYTYLNGKCAWRALLYRETSDSDDSVVTCADTRRNNTYIINIKSINHIGMPWDPSDPEDPNLPKTDGDPDTPPDIPDIEPKESYIDVYFEVLPWTKYSKTTILN